MTKKPDTPNILPDELVQKMSDMAREHGYGIDEITIIWRSSVVQKTMRLTYKA